MELRRLSGSQLEKPKHPTLKIKEKTSSSAVLFATVMPVGKLSITRPQKSLKIVQDRLKTEVHLSELHNVVFFPDHNFLLSEYKELRLKHMQLVQSFIAIAQEAAKQQTCQLNADPNVKAQPQLQQVRLDGKINDLFKVKPSGVGDDSASLKS